MFVNDTSFSYLLLFQAALGTNPLSVAAPGLNNDSIVVDMATTAVAVGKVKCFQLN